MSFPPPQGQPNNQAQPPQGPPGQQGAPYPPQGYPQQPPAYGQPNYQNGPGGQAPGFYPHGQFQNQGQPQADPWHAPLRGATMGQAFGRFFKKYATFSGRASRSEYWWVYLSLFVINIIPQAMMLAGISKGYASVLDNFGGELGLEDLEAILNDPVYLNTILGGDSSLFMLGSAISGLIGIITLIPSLALLWRRLHDTNHSGAMVFISLIPVIGPIILLVFLVTDSKPEGQRFDPPMMGR